MRVPRSGANDFEEFRATRPGPARFRLARANLNMFNFGLVRIASDGALKVSITDITGASWFDLALTPR